MQVKKIHIGTTKQIIGRAEALKSMSTRFVLIT